MEINTLSVSELIVLLQKCIEKFGDMPVGAYSAEYCYEIGKAEDLMGISLRVMTLHGGSSAENLPGIDLASDHFCDHGYRFLTIFYSDK